MAKRRWIGVIAGVILSTSGWTATSSPSLIATPPQPKWSELTVQQKIVLAPLSDDWDSLEYFRQKKWLTIVANFPKMSSDEQRRIQGQMQEWGKMTPEQRQLARENFKTANQLPASKKQELKQKWEEYSNLPEEEKERLKQQAEMQSVAKTGRPAALPLLAPVASAEGSAAVSATAAAATAAAAAPPAAAAAAAPPAAAPAADKPSSPSNP